MSFVTTARASPSLVRAGSSLLFLLTLPGHFETSSPAIKATYSAPVVDIPSADPFGSSGFEAQSSPKSGCPPLELFSRGGLLRMPLHGCAAYFNDLQDRLEIAFIAEELPAATSHRLQTTSEQEFKHDDNSNRVIIAA